MNLTWSKLGIPVQGFCGYPNMKGWSAKIKGNIFDISEGRYNGFTVITGKFIPLNEVVEGTVELFDRNDKRIILEGKQPSFASDDEDDQRKKLLEQDDEEEDKEKKLPMEEPEEPEDEEEPVDEPPIEEPEEDFEYEEGKPIEVPTITDKTYLGMAGDEHFYLDPQFGEDEETIVSVNVLDAAGEQKWSSEDKGIDPNDTAEILRQAITDVEIEEVSSDIYTRYLDPAIEQAKAMEVPLEDEEEIEPDQEEEEFEDEFEFEGKKYKPSLRKTDEGYELYINDKKVRTFSEARYEDLKKSQGLNDKEICEVLLGVHLTLSD